MSHTRRSQRPVLPVQWEPRVERSTGLCEALGLRDETCTLDGAHKAWHLDSDSGVAWSPENPRHRVELPAAVKTD